MFSSYYFSSWIKLCGSSSSSHASRLSVTRSSTPIPTILLLMTSFPFLLSTRPPVVSKC